MRGKLAGVATLAVVGSVVLASPAAAQDASEPATQVVLDNIFIFLAAVLVLMMQAGFGLLEAGLTSAKNASNIMMKNMMDACVGILVFLAIGYSIAYPGEFNDWIGINQLGVENFMSTEPTGLIPSVDFLFQAVFAATAATIVSGAVAGRAQFKGYLAYTVVITAFIYPIVVSWQWGGGWLADLGFVDFAGSGLVHMTGGVAALMGAIVIGPRIGKFTESGKPKAFPGHNTPLAMIGVLILFVGWFGFNPGSELAADLAVPVIAALTALAAAAGGVAAMITSWIVLGKPDVSMAGNGILAGLVAICSGIGDMDHWGTFATGLVAGTIVVLAVLAVERARIDDPVGAFSVHGVCGFWGLIATGLFATTAGTNGSTEGLLAGGGAELLGDQVLGGLAIAAFVAVTTGVLFHGIKAVGLLRVTPEEEIEGLDLAEHGSPGYGPEIQISLPGTTPAPTAAPSAVPAGSH